MRNTALFSTAAATVVFLIGCIVSDELTTLTIRPDGSADWIRFQSHIRSTIKGENGQQGFVVAGDKRSCLIDPAQVDELLRSQPEQVELFLEWELGDK